MKLARQLLIVLISAATVPTLALAAAPAVGQRAEGANTRISQMSPIVRDGTRVAVIRGAGSAATIDILALDASVPSAMRTASFACPYAANVRLLSDGTAVLAEVSRGSRLNPSREYQIWRVDTQVPTLVRTLKDVDGIVFTPDSMHAASTTWRKNQAIVNLFTWTGAELTVVKNTTIDADPSGLTRKAISDDGHWFAFRNDTQRILLVSAGERETLSLEIPEAIRNADISAVTVEGHVVLDDNEHGWQIELDADGTYVSTQLIPVEACAPLARQVSKTWYATGHTVEYGIQAIPSVDRSAIEERYVASLADERQQAIFGRGERTYVDPWYLRKLTDLVEAEPALLQSAYWREIVQWFATRASDVGLLRRLINERPEDGQLRVILGGALRHHAPDDATWHQRQVIEQEATQSVIEGLKRGANLTHMERSLLRSNANNSETTCEAIAAYANEGRLSEITMLGREVRLISGRRVGFGKIIGQVDYPPAILDFATGNWTSAPLSENEFSKLWYGDTFEAIAGPSGPYILWLYKSKPLKAWSFEGYTSCRFENKSVETIDATRAENQRVCTAIAKHAVQPLLLNDGHPLPESPLLKVESLVSSNARKWSWLDFRNNAKPLPVASLRTWSSHAEGCDTQWLDVLSPTRTAFGKKKDRELISSSNRHKNH